MAAAAAAVMATFVKSLISLQVLKRLLSLLVCIVHLGLLTSLFYFLSTFFQNLANILAAATIKMSGVSVCVCVCWTRNSVYLLTKI